MLRPNQKRWDKGLWWDAGPMVVKGCSIKVEFDLAALEKAVRGGPKVITIWNDLFHEDVKLSEIRDAYFLMAHHPEHLFLILTKRICRAKNLNGRDGRLSGEWPLPNVWLGTSAESQEEWNQRIPELLECRAAKRFVSVEPMLGPIDGGRLMTALRLPDVVTRSGVRAGMFNRDQVASMEEPIPDLVIIGCESGPNRRPCNIEWVTDLVDQCQNAGVPVFVKQLNIDGKVAKRLDQLPGHLRMREWPE